MRNVLVGEFLVPILESHKKSQAKSPQSGKVYSMVELRKKDIEIRKLRASCAASQSKITVLEEELSKEREVVRKFLENGVSLAKTVEELEKASEIRVATFKTNYETQLEALDKLEKQRQNNVDKVFTKLVEGRTDELATASKILTHYDEKFNAHTSLINNVSREMGDLKELVTNSLEGFKTDIAGHFSASSPPSPTYVDVAGSTGSGETVTMFVDLPGDGEGGFAVK
ncbi:hypothetical protein JTE90_006765 [Oedothorax gibbosus]|uniref:Uncharacterized protein n=1 Tax=Oedothorax gibbosus TaxID=931172 RepID=A0AAV6UJE4_9ARAC|nr:hypothetical protein JTE90_006765 [Oedothorax gibbosus]